MLAILLAMAVVPPALLLLVPRKVFPVAVGIIALLAALVLLRSVTVFSGCREFECVGAGIGFAGFLALAVPSAIAGLIRWSRIRRPQELHVQ